MLHDELVQRSRRCNKHRARTSAASSSPAGPLPGGGNRSRIASHYTCIERTDIDPKFESIRSDHTQNTPVPQTTFDLTSFTRQIASTVAANWLRIPSLWRIGLLQVRQHDFCVQAGIRKNDGLKFSGKNFFGDSRRFIDIAAANPEISVDHRRVVEHEELLACRCSVVFNYLDLLLDEL